MKKAQILSAIALAFALGIVAPVASTVSALTLEKENDYGVVVTAGKASYDEAQKAIAYAQDTDADYGRLANFYNVALAAYKTEVGPVATVPAGTVVWVTKTAAGIVNKATYDAINAIGATQIANVQGHLSTDAKTAFDGNTNDSLLTPAIATEILRTVAGAVDDYALYHAIYAAKDYNAYKVAAEAFNDNRPASVTDDIATTRAGYNDRTSITNYNAYKALFDIVDPALEAFDAYNTQLAKVEAAYKLLENNGQIKSVGQNAYKTAAGSNVKWHSIGDIIDVVMKTGVNDLIAEKMQFNTTNVDGAADWNTLTAAIDTLSKDAKKTGEGTIYNHIKAVAVAYKDATGDKTELNDLIVKMVGYKPTAKPEEKPEGPTDNGEETDAPNTGALLSSDKGATTVSIVAGLTTALTALGAGVVAYRNARRSSK